jgi:hypothetical protein
MRVYLLAALAVLAGAVGAAVPAVTNAAPADCGIKLGDAALETPAALACLPVDGSTDVSTGFRPSITFARPMDATSINRSSFTLTPAGGGAAVLGTVYYNAATLTAIFTPSYPLNYTKTYVATVSTAVRGLDQQPLAAPISWSFTTTGTPVTKRVNSGGPAYVSPSGAYFMADTPVTGSLTMSGGATRTTGAVVSGTSDPALYLDERYGVFTVNIIVPNGTYDVKLHFAETNPYNRPGRHIFSMDVLETPGVDVPNLDIAATVGLNRALVKTISNVTTTTSAIHVRSIAGYYTGDPVLSAVEVIPVAPRVTGTSPASSAADVSTTPTVRASFSRALDPSSVSSSSFTLTSPDGSAVPCDVGYDAATRTATLTANVSLDPSTTYTATLDGVYATDGMALDGPYSWSFTTQA